MGVLGLVTAVVFEGLGDTLAFGLGLETAGVEGEAVGEGALETRVVDEAEGLGEMEGS